jgi:hypothetical protein
MNKHLSLLRISTALLAGGLFAVPALAAEDFTRDAPKIVAEFANAPITLADAIAQVAKEGKLATQAKFEPDDKGKMVLSVYTSEKGKAQDAEHNVLQEHKGGFAANKWDPKTEVFKDTEHVARSAEFHALMRMTPLSLQDVAKKAESEGKVMWIQPIIADNKPQFEVGVVKNNQVATVKYDLMTGNKI